MKTAKMLTILVVALGLVVCSVKVSEAGPMGTAFTYQGHLYDTNYVANGEYDFQFKLYDDPCDPCDANQVGTDINKPDVDVIDGYFTIELDFNDPNAFNGDARWLEIGVRPGEMNDPNAYTPLSPRQEITPTPYALYAASGLEIEVRKTKGACSYLVAAANSPPEVLQIADYRCDGTDDDVQIQAAHDAIDPNVGGKICLSAGIFYISSPLQFNRLIILEGVGARSTELYLVDGSDCNMIELGNCTVKSVLSAFRHFRLNGNKDNNAGSLYGIVQQGLDSPYGWVDIQFEDLWIDRINGVGISLCNKWDHRIERCVFEHLDGAAIEFNLLAGQGLAGIWITDNFTLGIPQFIDTGTADGNRYIRGLVIQGNHCYPDDVAGSDDFVDLPPVLGLKVINNHFHAKFDTDNAYCVLKQDWTTKPSDTLAADIVISNNIIRDAGSNDGKYAKYGIQILPDEAGILQEIKIDNNIIGTGKTYGIMTTLANDYWRYFSITNNTFSNTGSGIYMRACYGGVIQNNFFQNTGTYSLDGYYYLNNVVFSNNYCLMPIRVLNPPNNIAIKDNYGPGANETVTTGSPTLNPWGYTKLNSSGGAITATLGDATGSGGTATMNPIGQMKTIVMTNSTNSSTVSVTNHETSDPEIFTFDAVDETLVLIWTGTEWATVKESCTH